MPRAQTPVTKLGLFQHCQNNGSTPDAAEFINKLYERIIEAGTLPSIQIAEAAVIENTRTQYTMNELAMLFDRMGLTRGFESCKHKMEFY